MVLLRLSPNYHRHCQTDIKHVAKGFHFKASIRLPVCCQPPLVLETKPLRKRRSHNSQTCRGARTSLTLPLFFFCSSGTTSLPLPKHACTNARVHEHEPQTLQKKRRPAALLHVRLRPLPTPAIGQISAPPCLLPSRRRRRAPPAALPAAAAQTAAATE